MPSLFRFVLAVLAVWRLTRLIAEEEGPWELCARLRKRLGQGFWGSLTSCFKCLSLWTAVPFAWFAGGTAGETFVSWLAISGGAVLLQELLRDPFVMEEATDEMLRTTERGDSDRSEHDRF